MRPLCAGVPVQARCVRCRNPIASQEVDDLKAVQAASGGNTEDGVHYHWSAIPAMIASIPFDTVIPAAVKLLF